MADPARISLVRPAVCVGAGLAVAAVAIVTYLAFRTAGDADAVVRALVAPAPAAQAAGGPPARVELTGAPRRIAERFVASAVRRRNLADSWNLVGPKLREDLSRADWLTGFIPVVPYLADGVHADYAVIGRDHGQLMIAVDLSDTTAKVSSETFLLEMAHARRGWIATYWVPYQPIYAPPAVSR